MKILFIGTVKFSKKALEKLIKINLEVVGVCTKESSKFNNDFADLVPLCEKNKIPYKFTDDVNSKDTIKWIKLLKPEIIFCFGWSSLIKSELLELPPMGVLGYHPTKLPENRGRHPLIWTLVLGLTKSASTFFFMDETADGGDILSQKDFDILEIDNSETLYNKVIKIALTQIEEFLPKLENKTFKKIKQNHKLANNWRKRGNSDGKIDFRMSSDAIYNLVRGLSKPYVGAYVKYNDKNIKVWKVKKIENFNNNFESGKVLDIIGNRILVKTYDGSVELTEHEFQVLPEIGEYL